MKKILLVILLLSLVNCQTDELNVSDTLNEELTLDARSAFPDILQLPMGFQPEGIAIGPQHKFYVGSLLNGKIYKGDLRSGEGDVFIDPAEMGFPEAQAVGLSLDKRSGYLFTAGGLDFEHPFVGTAYVYNYKSGALVQTFTVNSDFPVFLNDVIVTREAVYFTDSVLPVLYKIALEANGKLPDTNLLTVLPLTGFSTDQLWDDGFPLPIFGNGIDATPSGKMLIVGNLNRGELYAVNPDTGESTLIDLGGIPLFYADGILLDGKTLYVTQNFLNQIAVVKLKKDFLSGTVEGFITDPNFGVPSTIDEFGNSLYAVNAHFDQAPPGEIPDPNVAFEVIKVRK